MTCTHVYTNRNAWTQTWMYECRHGCMNANIDALTRTCMRGYKRGGITHQKKYRDAKRRGRCTQEAIMRLTGRSSEHSRRHRTGYRFTMWMRRPKGPLERRCWHRANAPSASTKSHDNSWFFGFWLNVRKRHALAMWFMFMSIPHMQLYFFCTCCPTQAAAVYAYIIPSRRVQELFSALLSCILWGTERLQKPLYL